jgi:hypothetical protein
MSDVKNATSKRRNTCSLRMQGWEKLPLTSDCEQLPPVETNADICKIACKVLAMSLLGISIGSLFVVIKVLLGFDKLSH